MLRARRFLYTSNGFDDDLSYWVQHLLVLPYCLDSNDMKVLHPNGFFRAGDMVDYVVDFVEGLEALARRGLPRLLNSGFHLSIVGRPGRFAAFRDILALLAEHRAHLWLARRCDIARAVPASVPPA